ncbi:hypothetical protein GCM10022222_53660 [Amycolatopsis ultiminotia]|uniref:Uncharacterized protein n=1 Tax=Amycolatopsis ultiminotia TaxID=543629 RepID=A0ABP6X9H8_9PSEU
MEYSDERSGRRYPAAPLRWRGDDGAPLTVAPLPGITRGDVENGARSLWRYRAALPGDLRPVSLDERRFVRFRVRRRSRHQSDDPGTGVDFAREDPP